MEWSEMLPELLVVIAHKHIVLYEDYPSFAGVCKSWRSAAVQAAAKVPKSNGPPSGLPSLLLAERIEDREFRELFLLSNERTRKIRLPEAYGKFCTSSRGWLATEGHDYAVQLVNPLLREIINLPSIATLPHASLETIEKGIWKLLVPSLEIVVVVWGSSGKLGFCQPGDNKWTPVLNGWCGRIEDMTYYNNRVYTFNINRHIQICDIYGDDPTIMANVSTLSWNLYNEDWFGVYILGWDGDESKKRLLVIIKETTFDDDDVEDELCKKTYMTERFQVLGYDLQSETWSEVKDLGKKTLFVGYNSSCWTLVAGSKSDR